MWGLQFWNILVQAAVDVNFDVLHDNGLKLLENLLKENVGVVSELKPEKKQRTHLDSCKTVTSRQNTEILIYFHYSETCTSNSEKCTSIQNNALLSGWSTHFEVAYDWIELTQQLIKSVQHSE